MRESAGLWWIPDWWRTLRRRSSSIFHPQRVILFGSQARGEAKAESDVDIFIEMETAGSPHQIIGRGWPRPNTTF
ncbi:MAG TPA: nucleotidyltransferase domain-containing protein [Terriglobia bacterium]|nr:nucleotidyltransferase domain-containing protein [Terriglobia bacterium]